MIHTKDIQKKSPINVLLILLIAAGDLNADTLSADKVAFFEKNVRPLLDKHCYKCHSEKSKKLKESWILKPAG